MYNLEHLERKSVYAQQRDVSAAQRTAGAGACLCMLLRGVISVRICTKYTHILHNSGRAAQRTAGTGACLCKCMLGG